MHGCGHESRRHEAPEVDLRRAAGAPLSPNMRESGNWRHMRWPCREPSLGLSVTRYIFRLLPIVAMSQEEFIDGLAPTFQRDLTDRSLLTKRRNGRGKAHAQVSMLLK